MLPTSDLNYFIPQFRIIISPMSQRKPWTKEQDALLKSLIMANDSKEDKLKWGDIADLLQKRGNARTGKQCRERWHNQLKPGIDNDRDWTSREQDILFRVQQQVGNKWAQIAKQLPGRTDNNIKNYFYSTLRKALRKVNTYVQMHKRENHYRNVKEFQQQTLSKILTVAEKKYQNKINLRNQGVEFDAQQIKRLLVDIQRNDSIVPSTERNQQLEEAVEQILEFNRNCRRRKGTKKDERSEAEEEQAEQVQSSTRTKGKSKAKDKNQQKERQREVKHNKVPKIESISEQIVEQVGAPLSNRRKSSNLDSSRNFSSGMKKLNSSSQLGFSIYPAGSGSNSQNYNPFDSVHYRGNDPIQERPFLSSIPNLQRQQTVRSNLAVQYWREQPDNPLPNMLQWSQNYNYPDENPLRMSHILETSSLMGPKRKSSRLQKKYSDINDP